MAGKFEGLTDLEWRLFEDVFPKQPEKRERGMPHVPFRHVLNTLLYILIAGCRWCDVPSGEIWASKSSAHRWLKRWQTDGNARKFTSTYIGNRRRTRINQLELWRVLTGLFPPVQGGGEDVAYGYKGKGILIHTLTDGNGMHARESHNASSW